MAKALLLFGSTFPGGEMFSSDIYWRTKFKTPDPFYFCEFEDGERVIFQSKLEYERAKKESEACSVELFDNLFSGYKEKDRPKSLAEAIAKFMLSRQISQVKVPGSFPSDVYAQLTEAGLEIEISSLRSEFYPERKIKTAEEIGYISQVQRSVEEVVEMAREFLHEASIAKDGVLWRDGQILTAESVRNFMDMEFMRRGCIASATIIACGDQAVDPHCEGSGPLMANVPIVFAVFPRSKTNFYWADMSRTFFKGEPTTEARILYNTVLEAQEMGVSMIRAGVNGEDIQNATEHFFIQKGYETGIQDGVMQGFIHSVGHGTGVDIHEPPYITRPSGALPEGTVVTVEPGLYYLGIGGVRIEDLVVVEKDGARNLTKFPKQLEDMVIP